MTNPRSILLFSALAGAATAAAVVSTHTPAPAPRQATPMFDGEATCISNEMLSTIFAEGTDPEVMRRVYEMILKPLGDQNSRYYTSGRWPGSTNTPVNITYSFPNDGLNVDGGSNIFNALMISAFGDVATGKTYFRQAFDQWEQFTGNTYTEVSDNNSAWGSSGPLHGGSGRGDIRIASIGIDGSSNVLAYNYFPGSGVGGDMVLDSAESWGNASNSHRFIRNIVTHENGHGMGLQHVCTDSGHRALMNPFYSSAIDGPQHDDIRGMQRHYGDFLEPNDSTGSATDLGVFASMDSAIVFGAAMTNSDDDFFSFTVGGPSLLSGSVTPSGVTYNMAPQSGDGSCSTGPAFNSVEQQDLRVTILNSVGGTIAQFDNTAAGASESFADVSLPNAGTYYVRVDSTSFANQTQSYNMTIETSIPVPDGDLNGDCVVDTADLGGLLGSFGNTTPFGDINGDGIVDTADLGILLNNFGTTCDDL
ncbi:MAG: matrixin family metalloprotease [Phycisphaeraceae bacterium]|nr:matrixin family metalloprotease [Phycisphaeraceae bacterium]